MLSLEINTKEEVQQLNLVGELAGIEALEFRQKIRSVISPTSQSILVDIQEISSMDLTGFNALVMLKSEADKRKMVFHIKYKSDNPINEYLHLSKLNLNQSAAIS